MDNLTIAVRARSEKEAVNLGYMVARRYFWPLIVAMLPGWGAAVALGMLLWWWSGSAMLGFLLVWWVKPLYERPALLRLSKLVFHQSGDVRQVQRAVFATGWLAELLWRRIACGTRVTRHSLLLLEGLRGAALRERMRFFAFRTASAGWSAALFLSLFETIAVITVLAFLPGLPSVELIGQSAQAVLAQLGWLFALTALLLMLASLLSAVFFVSIGFMLYLNHRVISEGWALALDLRKLAARLKNVALVVCAVMLLWQPQPSWALTNAQVQADKRVVERLLEDKDLSPYREELRRVRDGESHLNVPDVNSRQRWGMLLRSVLIVMGLVVVGWLLWLAVKRHGTRWDGGKDRTKSREDAVVTRLDGQAGGLSASFEQHGSAAALAALYCEFMRSAQAAGVAAAAAGESDDAYLQRAAAQLNEVQQRFLRDLLSAWRAAAFGQQEIAAAKVQALRHTLAGLWP